MLIVDEERMPECKQTNKQTNKQTINQSINQSEQINPLM
jgi:hypothetical protein